MVCAHDEEENLKQLIPLLLEQQYATFEVIIVNDRSNDATFDLLLEETKKDHRLRMVHVNRLPEHVDGKKYAITLGIKAATYDWVLLTDADCRPEGKNWISGMSQYFQEPTQFVLGFSPYVRKEGFLNLFIRFESLLTAIQYFSLAIIGLPYMGVGRNLAYRKSFFLDAKGFNKIIGVTGGDDDLFVNEHATGKNTAVCLDGGAAVYSTPKSTWRSFFHQKIRHLSVGKKYRFIHRFLLGTFMLSWIFTWILAAMLLILNPVVHYGMIGVFVFRSLVLTIVLHACTRRFRQNFETWTIPFLDFVFSIYYISTGLVALFTKKIQWKK
ncbi:MAG: glycosyltransferase [Cyclobacteriaceae bacterium]|nr:glycosyltransferase [Cyclobacteriaceae bacterium]